MKQAVLKKSFTAIAIALMLFIAATMPGVFSGKTYAEVTPPDYTLGNNLFAMGDFEVLEEGTDETTLTDPVLTFGNDKIGSLAVDSAGKIIRDGGNTYLKLSYSTTPLSSMFATWTSFGKIDSGEYLVTLDYKKAGTAFSTDNFGFRFAPGGADVNLLTETPTDIADGWKQVSFRYSVDPNLRDSISMWFNTQSLAPEVSAMLVDNIKIQPMIFSAKFDKTYAEFKKSTPADVVFTVDLMGNTFSKLSYFGEDVSADNYTITDGTDANAGKKILNMKKEYLNTLTKGLKTFTFVTNKGDVKFQIYIVPAQPAIPDIANYNLVDTLKGGDFEDLAVGYKMSITQTEHAWGSLTTFDDPGEIAEIDGSKVLMIKRDGASSRTFASVFAKISPSVLEEDNIFTMSFNYKFAVSDAANYTANRVTFSFVTAGNDTNHDVYLRTSGYQTETGKGTSNFSWPVTFTEKENGWVNASFSFIADNKFVGVDSLRFLFELTAGDGDKLYIDNATFKLWEEKGVVEDDSPSLSAKSFTFDKANQKDIELTCDLKGYSTPTIKLGTETVVSTNYTLSADKTKITIKKEYLKSLANGAKTFTLSTPGGSVDFTVTVSGEEKKPGKTGCGKGEAGIVLMLGAALLMFKRFKV